MWLYLLKIKPNIQEDIIVYGLPTKLYNSWGKTDKSERRSRKSTVTFGDFDNPLPVIDKASSRNSVTTQKPWTISLINSTHMPLNNTTK